MIAMALLPLNLDYTDKDFASLRARLFNLIDGAFPDWTDREVANFGNIMVELFAFAFDTLAYYQDNQAQESRLSDAQLRRSVLAIAKMLNYTPEGNSAASANLLVTFDRVPTVPIELLAGRVYETASTPRVRFQQMFDVSVPVGLDPPQVFVVVEHSNDADESFTSPGTPDFEVLLSGAPYIDNTLVVSASDGAYAQVDNFLASTATDRHYTVTVDDTGRATIRFGSGVSGKVPQGVITAFYRTGGGKAGNVDKNTITRIAQPIANTNNTRVGATVTNPSEAGGGADRESISSIKQKAPPSTRVTDRTVSLDDYEIGAENVPGVARALMITSDQVEGVPENRGYLYIVPDGGGVPSDVLRSAVETALTVTRPKTITFRFFVESPSYVEVDVQATVYFVGGASKRAVVSQIHDVLETYFQISNPDGTPNTNVNFGFKYGPDSKLPLSDVFATLEGVTGVRKLGDRDIDFLMNLEHKDLALLFHQFPRLGTVTIRDGDTGEVVLPA